MQQSHPSHPQSGSATISAEPQLRDLKKESTAFIPTSVKRKKGQVAGAASAATSSATSVVGKINAAPSTGDDDEGKAPTATKRPDLMSTLREQLKLSPAVGGETSKSADAKPKGDYEKFVEEMGDILG